jgi:hypothetical protein
LKGGRIYQTGDSRRRRLALAMMALAIVAIIVFVVVLLLRSGPEEAEAPKDAGAVPRDAGPVLETLPPDLAVDLPLPDTKPKPRPRPSRRITEPELRRLQRKHRALIKICYDRAARRAPRWVATRANVVVRLAGGGRVKSVQVDAGGDRALEGCLRRAVRGWRFSPTLKTQRVSFPIVFR